MSALLCKDCKHYTSSINSRHPMCAHPDGGVNFIDGTPATSCSFARSRQPGQGLFCGPEAAGFERAQPMLDKPECMASATLSSELDTMQAEKSAEQACSIAATRLGLALANPSPKRSSIEATTSRKYVSAVMDACRINVAASAVIVILPCGSAILSAPAGYGKDAIAMPLARLLRCHTVVDAWSHSLPVTTGALHLTNEAILQGGAA